MEKHYQLRTPTIQELIKEIAQTPLDILKEFQDPEVLDAFKRANDPYLHWEELRYKKWIPKKYHSNKELFWALLRVWRVWSSTETPIRDKSNQYFTINTKNYSAFLHTIDKEMAGNFMGIPRFSEANTKQFIDRGMIEEAIASSQFEGANTSRAAAKKLLLERRKPANHSEQMIVNNHRAMLEVEQTLYQQELSFELLCELHAIVTYNTLPPQQQGQLRETLNNNQEKLKIIPWSNTITYIAPDKEFVEAELPRLIDFANDKTMMDKENFTHPLIKGIMIHFWIGLLHPFEDGNGRLARILFYWYMLKHEYWAFKYLSLSEKIKKSPKQYAMSYVYSEQDWRDLTYFVDYNIQKLQLARKDFQSYIQHTLSENHLIKNGKQEQYGFNDRQIKLLNFFRRAMGERTNLSAYQQLYFVKKGAAIIDLKNLIEAGFLIKKKLGRNTYYYPTKAVLSFFDDSR